MNNLFHICKRSRKSNSFTGLDSIRNTSSKPSIATATSLRAGLSVWRCPKIRAQCEEFSKNYTNFV